MGGEGGGGGCMPVPPSLRSLLLQGGILPYQNIPHHQNACGCLASLNLTISLSAALSSCGVPQVFLVDPPSVCPFQVPLVPRMAYLIGEFFGSLLRKGLPCFV